MLFVEDKSTGGYRNKVVILCLSVSVHTYLSRLHSFDLAETGDSRSRRFKIDYLRLFTFLIFIPNFLYRTTVAFNFKMLRHSQNRYAMSILKFCSSILAHFEVNVLDRTELSLTPINIILFIGFGVIGTNFRQPLAVETSSANAYIANNVGNPDIGNSSSLDSRHFLVQNSRFPGILSMSWDWESRTIFFISRSEI